METATTSLGKLETVIKPKASFVGCGGTIFGVILLLLGFFGLLGTAHNYFYLDESLSATAKYGCCPSVAFIVGLVGLLGLWGEFSRKIEIHQRGLRLRGSSAGNRKLLYRDIASASVTREEKVAAVVKSSTYYEQEYSFIFKLKSSPEPLTYEITLVNRDDEIGALLGRLKKEGVEIAPAQTTPEKPRDSTPEGRRET